MMGLGPWLKSKVPGVLGGTPRNYTHVMNNPAGSNAREVAEWLRKGWIKDIPFESFEFDDALQVRTASGVTDASMARLLTCAQAMEKQASKRTQGKIVVRVR